MDSHFRRLERRTRALRGVARVALPTAAAVVAALPAPAMAGGRRVSEGTVRRLEAKVLGPAHALEHALERKRERRAIRRWQALSPAKRARLHRARRLAVHAADVNPSQVGEWAAPFALPVH